eukprot:SAG31_NODE_1504_length_8079_cov_2.892607_5_plen_68_part_00
MDVDHDNGMGSDLYESMAEGVSNSAVFVGECNGRIPNKWHLTTAIVCSMLDGRVFQVRKLQTRGEVC